MKFFSFVLLALWSISGSAATTTLTFENLQPTNFIDENTTIKFFNNPVTESGFTLTTTGSFSAKAKDYGYPVPDYYTGSTALQTNGIVSLVKNDGLAFSVNSIGLSNSYYADTIRGPGFSYPDPKFKNEIVTFTGIKSNGASVSQTFTLSTNLLTYNLINFDNIVALNWTATPNNSAVLYKGYQFDNISLSTISAPVPEPELYVMLLLGIGMVGLMSRRSKQV